MHLQGVVCNTYVTLHIKLFWLITLFFHGPLHSTSGRISPVSTPLPESFRQAWNLEYAAPDPLVTTFPLTVCPCSGWALDGFASIAWAQPLLSHPDLPAK